MYYQKSLTASNRGVYVASLIILIVLILERGFGVFCLDTNSTVDKSICKVHHRITSKLVSYQETYREADGQHRYPTYRILTRTNWRWQTVDEWETINRCCDGYEPGNGSTPMNCIPICHSNCTNGICLSPNLCGCNSGYREEMNNITRYSNCIPDCPKGCLGGNCTAPNTCNCDDGYFFMEDRGSCQAMCTAIGGIGPHGCVKNSQCVLPNKCQCNDGYIGIANSSMLPNQFSFNNEMDVFKSTFNVSNVICKAICEPKCLANSTCVAPNKCQCNSGYNTVSILEKGINSSQCTPICTKPCINGFCVAPDKCACQEGYYKKNSFMDHRCDPYCENGCIHGYCYKPDDCQCFDGYEKLIIRMHGEEKISDNKCVPICPGKCPNGTCFSPGECHCNPGYTYDFVRYNGDIIVVGNTTSNDTVPQPLLSCQPVCEPECPKGSQCIAPHQCHSENNWKLPTGIVGGILLLLGLVGFVVIYLAKRKKINIGIFNGMSQSNGRPMQPLETMDLPLHTSDK